MPETSGGDEHVLPLDLARLRETSEGDREFEAELLAIFIEDCASRIAALRQSLEAGDAETLRRDAHTIKGSARNLGTTRLDKYAEDLEHSAAAGRLEPAAGLIAQIQAEYEEFCSYAEGYIAEGESGDA